MMRTLGGNEGFDSIILAARSGLKGTMAGWLAGKTLGGCTSRGRQVAEERWWRVRFLGKGKRQKNSHGTLRGQWKS